MNKRRLTLMLGFVLAGHAALLRAQTVAGAIRRVGVLAPSTRANEEITLKPFFEQMRQLGWIEGQNITYDRVYADDQLQRLPALAVELVARKPELIYAPPNPAAVAAKQATDAIPIVFGAVWDPVSTGLVANLARPGGNVTGICVFAESLAPKRIQLLREIMPGIKRLGWLGDAADQLEYEGFAPQAAALGVAVVFAEAANPPAVEAALGRLFAQRVDVIYCGASPLLYNVRERLLELANQQHLPVIAYREQFADAGALFCLRHIARRPAAALGIHGRQNPQGRQAGRHSGGAGDVVSTGRQCQDRQTAGYQYPEVHPAACGPGDRVMWRCYGRSADEVIQ